MMNEEKLNKEEIFNEEHVEDVSNLVEYYIKNNTMDPLPSLLQCAVKQNVSFAYEWFINMHMRIDTKESWYFSTYRCLVQAQPSLYGNYLKCMQDEFDVDEEVLNKVLTHIRSGLVPYQLWIDKLISDIQRGGEYFSKQSLPGLVLVYLMKTMRTSIIGYIKLHKALLDEENKIPDEVKDVVIMAHTIFLEMPKELKQEYMEAFASENPVIQRAFQDNELSLFSETLIDIMRNPIDPELCLSLLNGELPPFTKFWVEPVNTTQPIINRSRGNVDLQKIQEERLREGLPTLQGGMLPFDTYVLGYSPDGESPKTAKLKRKIKSGLFDENEIDKMVSEIDKESGAVAKKDVEYVVEKVAKDSSSRVMSKTSFETKPEAEKFIKTVTETAPDMLKVFEFRIVEKEKETN